MSSRNEKKLFSMIGLSTKAGKTFSGEFSVENAVRRGKARLVIIAQDASDNTKKNFTDMCHYHHVPVREKLTKEQLGACCGCEERAVLCITDEGLGRAVLRLADEDE